MLLQGANSKRLLFLLLCMGFLSAGMAQLKAKPKCPEFYVDILNGTVNGFKPDRTLGEIREAFPCTTSVAEEESNAKCGSGAFYKDRDLTFFIKRQYVEIGPKFKGKLSIALLGAKRGSLFSSLGNPKLKDEHWDAYEMQYGTLVLHYDAASKINLIQFSTKSTEELQLCE